MTREEAIICLQGLLDNPLINKGSYLAQALEMAIKALEHPERNVVAVVPCGDTISRQAVLDELNKWDWQELYLPIHFKENIIDVVPSVNPQEPKTDVLDKIRAEIEKLADDEWNKQVGSVSQGLEDAIEIIDKYKAGSEGEHG